MSSSLADSWSPIDCDQDSPLISKWTWVVWGKDVVARWTLAPPGGPASSWGRLSSSSPYWNLSESACWWALGAQGLLDNVSGLLCILPGRWVTTRSYSPRSCSHLVLLDSSSLASKILLCCRSLTLWSVCWHTAGNALKPGRLPALLSWWCNKLLQVSTVPCWSIRWPSLHPGAETIRLRRQLHLHQYRV